MNVVSFVDRDMFMRYFGGGIGHLKNAPPLQVPGFDPIDPSSEEIAVEEEDGDDPCGSTVVLQSSIDVVMNGGELVQLEVGEDDEDDKDDEEDDEDSEGDEGEDQIDDDEDEEGDSDSEDDYDY